MPCNVDKVITRKRDFYVTLISFARMLRKKEIVVIVGDFNGPYRCNVEDLVANESGQ